MLFDVRKWFALHSKFTKAVPRLSVLLLVGPGMAFAAYVPAYTILNETQDFEIHVNGGYTLVHERSIRIDTPQGVDHYGQAKLPYDGKRSKLDIVEAYTLKPNGEKVMVSPDKIKRQSDAVDDVAPYFTDGMEAVIIFPQVDVGSELYFKSVLVKDEPTIKGHFSDITPFTPQRRYDNATIRLTHPAELEIQAYARDVEGSKSILPDGRIQYHYSYKQDKAYPLEPNQVDYEDFAPVVQFSNYKSYVELAKVTQELFQPKTQITPVVQALADKLTNGIESPRKKAQKLYDWVSANIRYVGIDVGSSGYEPHYADEILANRYGDCKDHAVILEALLMAAGIPSSPALIRTTDSYQLPHLAGNYYFNHVISYLPQLNLYLDSTAQFAEFGTLPPNNTGKPTLITQSGVIGQTPVSSPAIDYTVTNTKLKLMPDGSIVGSSKFVPHGYYKSMSRAAQFGYENKETRRVVDALLRRFHETGTGELKHGDPLDLDSSWVVASEFKLEPVVNLPGPSALSIPYGLVPGYIKTNTNFTPYESRRNAYACGSNRHIENVELTLPSSIKISRIPKGSLVKTDDWFYKSSYKLNGNKLYVTREMTTDFRSDVCKPSEQRYLDMVQLIQQVKSDLRSQVFVE